SPGYTWSKEGYQIAWTRASNDKLISGVDFTTLKQLPAVDPASFSKPVVAGTWGPGSFSADKKYQAQYLKALAIKKPGDILKPSLLSMYTEGEDWVVWTAEGYYAASPGGE